MKSPVLEKNPHTILNMILDTILVSINLLFYQALNRAKLNPSIVPRTVPGSPRFYSPAISQRNFFPSHHQVVLYHGEPQCSVTHIYMITGLEVLCEHMGPSHLLIPLIPCSWWLCFERKVPRRAHSSFLHLKEPFLGRSFYETWRRDEFHFMSGLRGQESLSCLAQGWDALNKGGVAAVKNPRIGGRRLQPLLSYTPWKRGCHCSISQHSNTRLAPFLATVHSPFPVYQHHSSACASQKGQFGKQRQAVCRFSPWLHSNCWTVFYDVLRAHIVTWRAWGDIRQPYLILISVRHSL